MPRSMKVLLGAATGVLLALAGYLLVRAFGFMIGVARTGAVSQAELDSTFQEILTLQLVAVGFFVVLLGVYLWHLLVHTARRESAELTLLWTLALLVLPVFAMPVYWSTRIWPENAPKQAGRTR